MFKFFQTIKTIKKLKAIEPRKNWLKNQRIYFNKMLDAQEPVSAVKTSIPFFFKSRLAVSLTALIIILSLSDATINFAQAALPSDTLFPIKLFTEKIQGFLTVGDENKVDFALKLAEKRLEEIEKQIEKNKDNEKNKNIASATINRAKNNMEKAETLIKNSSGSNKDKNLKHIEKTFKKLEKISERKNRIAEKLTGKIPDLTESFNSLDLISIKIEEKINKKISEAGLEENATNIIKNQAKKSVERAENKIRNVGKKLLNADFERDGRNGKSEKDLEEALKKLEQLAEKLEKSAKKIESATKNLNDAKQQLKNKNFNEAFHKANEGFKNSAEIE